MTEHPTKLSYMGEDIEKMSRERLIEVVRDLAGHIDRMHKTTRSIIEIHELERARRAHT